MRRMFPYYSISSTEERERERERERGEREREREPALFVILQFLTLTFLRYKKVERETKEAAIKFSIGSLRPKFLHLSMQLSLFVT